MTLQREGEERMKEHQPFWGLRETQSKGMRFNTRQIWHYFTYQETWARGEGMLTVCHAKFDDNELHTLGKIPHKPPRGECCASCYRIFNKKQRAIALDIPERMSKVK